MYLSIYLDIYLNISTQIYIDKYLGNVLKGVETIMKKYLITGGAGFIGSNFIYYLLEKYGNDILIVNYSYNFV